MNAKDDFLGSTYEAPVSEGNYMKFKKGKNQFRVLSSAVVGHEYWTKDNKPVRSRTAWEELPSDAKPDQAPKFFWAFLVYNYGAKKAQILEITQKGIREALEALLEDVEWGSPKGYDIVITATGEGLEREYTVMPKPHSKAPETSVKVNLEALFTGEDPFNSAEDLSVEPVSEQV